MLASPPSWITGLTKWVHRHRAATIAAGVLTLVITLGATVTAVLLAREQAATTQALHESEAKERALQVSNEELEKERKRAEENLRSARAAVDRMLTRRSGRPEGQAASDGGAAHTVGRRARSFISSSYSRTRTTPRTPGNGAGLYPSKPYPVGPRPQRGSGTVGRRDVSPRRVGQSISSRSVVSARLIQRIHCSTRATWGGPWPEMSVETAERLVSQARSIAEQNPSDPSHWELVASYETGLGNAYRQGGTASQAETHLREALRILKGLYDDHPELPQDRSAPGRSPALAWLILAGNAQAGGSRAAACLLPAFQREMLRSRIQTAQV